MTDTQLQFYIKLDGSDASAAFMSAIEMFEVESTLHMPSMATITLYDPDLILIDQTSLAPAATLVIQSGKDKKELFDGEIVEIEPEFNASGVRLVIRAFDRMHRLAHGDYTRAFVNVKVSDLVSKLANDAGLQASPEATTQVHANLLQSNQTNLHFLQQHSARLGMYLSVRRQTLYCKKPAKAAEATLRWNESLTEFRPRLRGTAHVEKVSVKSWDIKSKNAIIGQATAPTPSVVPSIGAAYKKLYTYNAESLISDCRIETQDEATKHAQAQLNRHTSQYVEAEGQCLGDPSVLAGVTISIENVGTRFSGKYTVTNAIHRFTPNDGYTTEFRVSGMNADGLLTHLLPHAEQPTLGMGLMTGIVTNNNDPENYGRVKLKYPWLSDSVESGWARIISAGGGQQRGFFALPEVNDEVLVGFEQGDINRPFVLGGLWNGQDKPPLTAGVAVGSDGKVKQRVFMTRSGHKLLFDDSDNEPGISIVDKTGNNKIIITSTDNKLMIAMDGDVTISAKQNISVEATQDMKLSAKDITLSANGKLTLKSLADTAIEAGANLDASANAKATVKGNAGVDVTSTGITNVKGSLLNLN